MTRKKKVSKVTPSESDNGNDSVPGGMGFPIVGIGASAGGLEAVQQLLTQLPTNTGMGFVLVQHLDPKHESLSAEIFSRATRMKVAQVKDGVRVQPNCLYIIPPNASLKIQSGVLNLVPRTEAEARGPHLVIDLFLQSLAEDLKNRAVGVILSGNGSDGTSGLKAIQAQGGITLVQTPKSAKFDSMPKCAVNSGAADLILSPIAIAEELVRIAHHPYVTPKNEVAGDDHPPSAQEILSRIFLLLRNHCHVDFSQYKLSTIRRRMDRRMVLHRIDDLAGYEKFLVREPSEIKALYADLLINVTKFFRDPEAFKALKETVLPKLLADRAPGAPIRVWSPGCSTGEEVYSLAITILEYLGKKAALTPIQIFGSDLSEAAIQKARLGEYPESITREVSGERLNRYFVRLEGGGFKVSKSVRDICLFSRHDVTADPPFAKIDLVSCRNLLIYFTAVLQKRVIPIFHYALVPKGYLLLGKSESIGGFSGHFSVFDKTNNIYSRKNAPFAGISFPARAYVPGQHGTARKLAPLPKGPVDLQKVTDRAVQEAFPGVLINEELQILHFRGRTGPFITPAAGLPSNSLLKMANPEILTELRMAIQAAKRQKAAIKKEGLILREGRSFRSFNLRVLPIRATPQEPEYYYLVQFEDAAKVPGRKNTAVRARKSKRSPDKSSDSYVVELQQELISSQEYQQSLVEKSDAAQENLSTANEELQSANEELQSTNEELETAKEELQSGNEELTTVNDELRSRSLDQIQTNNDLVNLLASVQIAIVMLGNDRKIRRFTPLAGRTLNLIPADIGRPLSDLRFYFSAPGAELNVEQVISEVIESMEPQEVEVRDVRDRWFRLQVRPYKTSDGVIDGAVLALVDIDVLKQSLREVNAAKAEADRANRAKDLFLATLSHELRTPLTAILSWAQLLQSGKLGVDKIVRAGQMIEDCGNTQAGLINDLLDVSRIIMGKLPLEMREVSPAEIILHAVDSVRSTAEKKAIQIETAFDPQAGTVMGDPLRLQQVFLNLLTNALKFSAPQSRVIVKLTKTLEPSGERAKVQIAVVDSGKGISPEFIPHIFDSFSQEDSSSIRVHGGLGLGLAIVRSLVELHGGSVVAESAGLNRGATFTVILPRKAAYWESESPNQVPQVQAFQPGKDVALNGLRVLVVEDDASSREVFLEILKSYGAEVRAVGSAREALEAFHRLRPDVLISDVAMPGEDGYSLIQKIRAFGPAEGGNVPAIAVTAHAGKADIQRAISAGFQYHVAKPVDFAHFVNLIATLGAKKSGN